MVVVAIIGILASVAYPTLQRSTLRARRAERDTVMTAIASAVQDIVQGDGSKQGVPGGTFLGDWNPATLPTTGKLPMDWKQAGWKQLPMIVQGESYYQYKFIAVDPNASGDTGPLTLDVFSVGDLDSDGVLSHKSQSYIGLGFSFRWDSGFEDPDAIF
jgi:type II secretory pathway pseudopilin PulG